MKRLFVSAFRCFGVSAFLLGGSLALPGCSAWASKPPVEEMANKIVDEGIVPGIKQALAEGLSHMQGQAGAQVVNPRYVVTIDGKWVTGIECKISVGVEGLAGQVQISAASPAEALTRDEVGALKKVIAPSVPAAGEGAAGSSGAP